MSKKNLQQKIRQFRRTIWSYYRRQGRHHLPWRKTTNPYRIVVSEIMLQQTQVDRVIPKYKLFLKTFPTFKALAQAQPSQVLKIWQGLGYNRRALALHKLSQIVVTEYKGKLPSDPNILVELPGIGPATASSIAAFAYNHPSPFIETNIRRVYIHFFFNKTRTPIDDQKIMKLIEASFDQKNPREWYWALMDYGTMLAAIGTNANIKSRHYRKQSTFSGSMRQLRGAILRKVLSPTSNQIITVERLVPELQEPLERIEKALAALEKEGFVARDGDHIIVR